MNPLSAALLHVKDQLPADRTRQHEQLTPYTYIRLGGQADLFTIAKSAGELVAALTLAHQTKVSWFVLGAGSNVLIGDQGYHGLVIKNEARKISVSGQTIKAESGVLLNQLVTTANSHGLAGLQLFMSVPGTVGGAVYNNSHFRPSHNEFIGIQVSRAKVWLGGRVLKVNQDWFRFAYDYSRLQDEPAVVLEVEFDLRVADPKTLNSQSVKSMKERHERQPIGLWSCGCMFQNPGSEAAAKLIDQAGLRGLSVKAAAVSDKHANFVINQGGATVAEVLELMAQVHRRVKEKFNVDLRPEVFLVGEFTHVPAELAPYVNINR